MSDLVIRHDWTYEEADKIYHMPFLELLWQAQNIHRACF